MTLLGALKAWRRSRNQDQGERLASLIARVVQLWQIGRPVPVDGDRHQQRDLARLASLYRACVSERSTAVGQAQLVVQKDGVERKPTDDPLAYVIANPTSTVEQGLTQVSLMRRLEDDVWTYGEAILQKRRSQMLVTRELWPLRVEMTEVVLGPDGLPDHYAFGPEALYATLGQVLKPTKPMVVRKSALGTTWALPPRDIIHLKRYNPRDENRGLSPVVSLAVELGLDRNAILYLGEIFRNGGIPSAILSLVEDVDDDTADRYKERWREIYGRRSGIPGKTGWGDIGVFGHSAKVEKFGLDPSNMDLSNVFRMSESRVCALLQVPALLVGAASGNEHSGAYGHMRETRWSWWWEHVIPELVWMQAELTLQLAKEFGEGYTVRADISNVPALQGARSQSMRDAAQVFTAMLLDRDEAREHMGKRPTDDGKRVWADQVGVAGKGPALAGAPGSDVSGNQGDGSRAAA